VANTRARADRFRRHIHHCFTVGEQALGDVAADAVAALDCPKTVVVLAASGEHGLVAVAVGEEPALSDRLFPLVDDFDGGRTLVRIHPDDDASQLRISLS
jgi:hypothetical protein